MLASTFLSLLAAAGPSLDGLAAVRSVLQRTEGAASCPEDVLVRRLTALGSVAAPALFALVSGEAVEELLGESDAAAWLCAPDRVGALALESLANLPELPVRASLRAAASARPERHVRVAALGVLGRQGSAGGFPLYFELLTESGEEIEMRAVRAPASAALAAILQADPQAARALEAPLLAASVAEQRLVCEALAGSGRAETCGLMQKLIGRDPELDLTVLEALADLAARFPWRLTENTLGLLRTGLEHSDARMRAAGARALGRMRDARATPALIARLDDPDADAQRAVRWALRECTGQTRISTREEWQAWLEGERSWWKHSGRARLDALTQGDTTQLAPAVRDALKHPLARQPLADGLLVILSGLEPGAKSMACATLAQLGARQAVPALVELLFEPDPLVRAAAWNALQRLTGETLPAEPLLWEEYAFG
jgi:hypothetical protein